jgi:hypothetical protein
MDQPRIREVPRWTTVGITALPEGWRNVYFEDDGNWNHSPCPVVLLQEHRQTYLHITYEDGRTGEQRNILEPPYETRAVFAEAPDFPLELTPAVDTYNYLGTFSPTTPDSEIMAQVSRLSDLEARL